MFSSISYSVKHIEISKSSFFFTRTLYVLFFLSCLDSSTQRQTNHEYSRSFIIEKSRPLAWNHYHWKKQTYSRDRKSFELVVRFSIHLFQDWEIKSLVIESYHMGPQELLYIIPFVAKILESCAKSKVESFVCQMQRNFHAKQIYLDFSTT